MIDQLVLDVHAAALAAIVADRLPPTAHPIRTDSWIARSILQKAIRRGMTALALRAAATLLKIDKRTFWRRLLITSLEDLGPCGLATTASIVAAINFREFRADPQIEWVAASHLVELACAGTRDQTANALAHIARYAPELAAFRSSICDYDLAPLLEIAGNLGSRIEERACAALVVGGEGCGDGGPVLEKADPAALFATLQTADGASEILWQAHRRTGVGLAALNLLLLADTPSLQSIAIADYEPPPINWLGEIPSFAFDQYVRSGRRAIAAYVRTSSRWRNFAGTCGLHQTRWSQAAGELIFRGEGTLVTNRASYAQADSLFERSATLGCFLPESAVAEGVALIQSELPLIDKIRRGHLTT